LFPDFNRIVVVVVDVFVKIANKSPNVQASASPVLENLVYKPRKNWNSERIISILGVPSDVVFAFLQFIYSSRLVFISNL